MNDDCRPQRALLAEGPFCKVECCECGTIHVSLGPITLRLRVDVVESICVTLGEALMHHGVKVPRRKSQVSDERPS